MIQIAPLKSVCEIIMGQAPSGDTYNHEHNGWPLIAGASDFGKISPLPSRFTTSPSKLSKVDDIIICIRATIGDLNWSDKEYCLGRGVASLRVDGRKADKNYIWRVVEFNAKRLSALGRGATFKQISKPDIADFEIPLPPLEEQKRIAAILDQADDIRCKRQHAIDRLNQLGQAIFHEMFGDPAMRTVSLGEVCQFQYGNSLPASIRDGIGYDVYGSNGVVGSHNKGLTKGPTLIIGRKGSVGEINFSDSPCWPIDTTYYVDSSSTQQNLRWLFYALQNLKLQSLNKATGVPGLNRNDAYRLEIPLPPLEEQKLFADRVQEIDEFLGRMSETLSVNDALFTSLQHRAFAGEL